MRKKATPSTRGKITVKVARFNEATEEVKLKKGSTVEEALEEAGKDVSASESMWINGEEAEYRDVVEDGDLLQIVGSKAGGLN